MSRACLSVGAVAQLVERVVRNDEVRGSTPLGSTKSYQGFEVTGKIETV